MTVISIVESVMDGDHSVVVSGVDSWSTPARALCRCGWSFAGFLAETEDRAEDHIIASDKEATR